MDERSLPIQKQQRRLRLILRRGAHPPHHGQVRQELLHFRRRHLPGMPLAVKEDEAFNPLNVLLLGTDAVVPEPEALLDLLEQPGPLRPREVFLGEHWEAPRWPMSAESATSTSALSRIYQITGVLSSIVGRLLLVRAHGESRALVMGSN